MTLHPCRLRCSTLISRHTVCHRSHPARLHTVIARRVPSLINVTTTVQLHRQNLRLYASAATGSTTSPEPPIKTSNNPFVRFGQFIKDILPRKDCVLVLKALGLTVAKFLLAIVIIYLIRDTLQFFLHRVTHRLTNWAAEVVFEYPISQEVLNPWWLVLDQDFLEEYSGYQLTMAIFFAITLPINLLLNSVANSIAILLVNKGGVAGVTEPEAPKSPPSTSQGTQANAPASTPLGAASLSLYRSGASLYTSTAPAVPGRAAQAAAARIQPSAAGPAPMGGSLYQGGRALYAGAGLPSSAATEGGFGGAAAGPGPTANAGVGGPMSLAQQRLSAAASTSQGSTQSGSGGDSSSSSTASAAAGTGGKATQSRGIFAPVKDAWGQIMSVMPDARAILWRVWWVEVLASVASLSMQGLMMLVLPILFILPWFLSIQLSTVTAVLEGTKGIGAMKRSDELMRGSRATYAWPLLLLILTTRAADYIKVATFALLPQRFWVDALEIPIAAYLGTSFLRLLVSRLQDLLPLAMFLYLKHMKPREAAAEAAAKQQ